MTKKKGKKQQKFGVILLFIAFIIASISSYFYLRDYTNFSEQAKELVGERDQSIKVWLVYAFITALVIFGIFIMFFSRRFKEMLLLFLIDSISLISAAMLILGVFFPYKIQFKLAFIILAFIMYYTSSIAKGVITPRRK